MTLKKLPIWSVSGPMSLKEHPIPEDNENKFEPNHEINSKVSFWMRGDSASLAADAIVNAANEHLYPGGGICGVIHHAAGPELAEACEKLSPCKTGDAVVTEGFNLPAKYVIHAVGPIGEKPDLLKSAYESTLNCIDGEKIRSVGLCCISTGIYGYPIEAATHVALETVRTWLENEENRNKTDRIIFVVFERRDVEVYFHLVHQYFPLTQEEITAEPPKIEEEEEEDNDEKNYELIEKDEKEKDPKSEKKLDKQKRKQEKKDKKVEKKAAKAEKKEKKKLDKAKKKTDRDTKKKGSSSSSSSTSSTSSESDDDEAENTKKLLKDEKNEEKAEDAQTKTEEQTETKVEQDDEK